MQLPTISATTEPDQRPGVRLQIIFGDAGLSRANYRRLLEKPECITAIDVRSELQTLTKNTAGNDSRST